ncbi:hypothetical protein [Enterococcus massiliensis]|uniref:hypothetical protein n=1 Tax=Enterococcus massiliensis TaxID=1640685 RepID=UPI00065E43DF|nr:hypothetical protein [Enterococcus massiliensis]
MLNVYFALGVPVFLLLLYLGIALFRRKKRIPYLGFALFIIAGFLTAFSFQVIQFAFHQLRTISKLNLEAQIGYPIVLLGFPLVIGIILVVLNIYRGYLRVKGTQHK